jgi:hypothetical protein
VKPISSLVPTAAETTVGCAVAAFSTRRAGHDDIGALRQSLRLPGGSPFPVSFLKHSEEQTVAGLAAIIAAIEVHGLGDVSFADWAVLAGPRFLGRPMVALALERFALEGAWGVSPHLIPHRSLHSVSGTISQALGIHGPNFGVGGGPQAAAETILAAAALLSEGRVPGVWILLTGLHPDPMLPRQGLSAVRGHKFADSVYLAAALALTPMTPDWDGPQLHIWPDLRVKSLHESNGHGASALLPEFSLESLVEELDGTQEPAKAWRLGCGGWMKLQRYERGTETWQ